MMRQSQYITIYVTSKVIIGGGMQGTLTKGTNSKAFSPSRVSTTLGSQCFNKLNSTWDRFDTCTIPRI